MSWNELVKLALLGTDRAEIPDKLKDQWNTLGIATDDAPPRTLLHAAACYANMQKVGQPLTDWTGKRPEPVPASSSINCSLESSIHLKSILESERNNSEQLLKEFVLYLVHFKLTLPPELLPNILQRALRDATIWALLQPAIGARGQWLIALNPQWRPLLRQIDHQHWETGRKEERLAYLRQMRAQQAKEVPELLASTWSSEDHTTKKAFLEVMEDQLSQHDEEFLEQALDDKRKEVRMTAVRLLAQIPSSDYAQRMFERVSHFLELDDSDPEVPRPLISLPEKCTKDMIRDGVNPRQKWSKSGLKASRLLQMLGFVAPERWESHFGSSAEELINIFARGEWALLLLQGLIDASVLHKNKRWRIALLKFWIRESGQKRWEALNLKQLLPQLDNLSYNELSLMAVKKAPIVVETAIPAVQLLQLPGYHWEDKLSMLTIKQLKTWISNEHRSYWQKRPYDHLLANAALSVHPRLHKYFHDKWPVNDYIWATRSKEVDDFLNILAFRKKMILALERRSRQKEEQQTT